MGEFLKRPASQRGNLIKIDSVGAISFKKVLCSTESTLPVRKTGHSAAHTEDDRTADEQEINDEDEPDRQLSACPQQFFEFVFLGISGDVDDIPDQGDQTR